MTVSKPTELWDYPEFRGCRPLATEIGLREGLDAALVFQTVFMVCLTIHGQMRKPGHPDEDILDDFPTDMVRGALQMRRDNPAEYFGDGMVAFMEAGERACLRAIPTSCGCTPPPPSVVWSNGDRRDKPGSC